MGPKRHENHLHTVGRVTAPVPWGRGESWTSQSWASADVGTPEHVHHRTDEAYYVLDGMYRFKVGPEVADVGAGAFIYIPRGTPHAWLNVGDRPGRVVSMFSPGGMAGYFEELRPFLPELLAAAGDMSAVDPETLRKAGDVMQRHHHELVGPPLVR